MPSSWSWTPRVSWGLQLEHPSCGANGNWGRRKLFLRVLQNELGDPEIEIGNSVIGSSAWNLSKQPLDPSHPEEPEVPDLRGGAEGSLWPDFPLRVPRLTDGLPFSEVLLTLHS